jgi:hypothetical protein
MKIILEALAKLRFCRFWGSFALFFDRLKGGHIRSLISPPFKRSKKSQNTPQNRLPSSFASASLVIIGIIPLVFFGVPTSSHRPIFDDIVTGDAFRSFADHAFDELDCPLIPELVMESHTVFVRTDYLSQFFEEMHPRISNRYILITHNSDDPVPGSFKSYLEDPKIIAWFGENAEEKHPKLISIPMGCANFNWPNGNQKYLKNVQEKLPPKQHLLHMGLTIQTNYNERWPIFKQFYNQPYCYRTIKKMYEGYLTDVAASAFEIAPRGIAWDTYRLWESLYVGTIPIVRTSPLDELYLSLPVLIIKDWKEVTEDFLRQKEIEMRDKTYDLKKLSMEYWKNLIHSYRYTYRDRFNASKIF